MAEQELKEKIVKTITNLNNICRKGCACKYCKYENYDNCTEYAIANALITAGIGDVSELQFDNEVLKMRNFFLEGSERSTEEDRQVWINKWKEAEHKDIQRKQEHRSAQDHPEDK